MRRTTAPLTMIAASSTTLTRVRRRSAADDRWGPRIGASVRTSEAAAVAPTGPRCRVDYGAWPLRPPYDEFALFHENAEEFGIPWNGPPAVRRVEVATSGGDDQRARVGYRHARARARPRRRAERAHLGHGRARARPPARRDRPPRPRSFRAPRRSRVLARARTRSRSSRRCARSRPTRASSSACRSAGSPRSRSPTARPTSCASSCSST